MTTLAQIYGIYISGGGAPPDFTTPDFAPATWTVRLYTPKSTYSTRPGSERHYSWAQAGWAGTVSFDLDASSGDSAQLTWALNQAGQVKVSLDRWRMKAIWEEAVANPEWFYNVASFVGYIVPEATTIWIERNGDPVWGGSVRDVDFDTGSPNVTITGEEFTSMWDDLGIIGDWSISGPVSTTLARALAQEEDDAVWMRTYMHASTTVLGSYTLDHRTTDTRRVSELVEALSVAGPFEWQQWIGWNANGWWEAMASIHPGRAGLDYHGVGRDIEWGAGTAETVTSARWTVSTRSTRTKVWVSGADDALEMWGFAAPLNVPRRDLFVRSADLSADLVGPAARELVVRQGWPQLSARVVLRVGDFAGGWPWLWIPGPTGGGCSPVGSRFWTRLVDAGMTHRGIMRAATWGVSVGPTGEYMIADLVQDESASLLNGGPLSIFRYV